MENEKVEKSESKVKKTSTKNYGVFTKEIKELYKIDVVNRNISITGDFMTYISHVEVEKITSGKLVIEIQTDKIHLTLFKNFAKVILVVWN